MIRLTLLLLVMLSSTLLAQDVVVSEYRNDVDQGLEWTEIVVVADNIDLRGYIVTDNRGAGDQRQSGPRFKNIPHWQHVRAGTIILIYHGPRTVVVDEDVDLADGYMELSQFDTRYFDIVNVDGAPSSNGMNINQDRDFVQVLKADSSHVHGLMHGAAPGPTWLATPNPKAGYDTSNIGPRSVCVSGRSLAAYNAGRNNDSTSTGRWMTPGLPNSVDERKILQGKTDVNYLLWQEWREPEWSATPTVQVVEQTATKHTISWTPVVDTYTADRTTGYIVLRDTANFAAFPAGAIVDGTIYTVGQVLHGAEVIALVPTADGATYADSSNLQCGTSYTYRIYAYRFAADDNLGQPAATTARGRQYAPQHAQSPVLTKSNPTKPQIAASRLQICPGDTLTLTTTTTNAEFYQWTVNGVGVTVSGTTRIVVNTTGTYRLKVIAPGGCFAESDPITISPLPAPSVILQPTGQRVICNGDSVVLTAQAAGATAFEWRRNGTVIPGATGSTFTARLAGEYQVYVRSSEGCPGISRTLTISYHDVQYTIQPATVDFGTIGSCQNAVSKSIQVTNTGTERITIAQISLPTGFAVVSPAPGFVIAPGETVTVQLLFAPAGTGVVTGTASLRATPCDVISSFSVRGERVQGEVSLSQAGIDFGVFTACPTGSDIREVRSFTLNNTGTSPVTVRAPLLSPPFYLLTAFGTRDLGPGESFTIDIQYRPFALDQNRAVAAVIRFPYVSQSCNDTLQASLTAASYYPAAAVAESSIDVGFVLNCVGYADTSVTVTNTSQVPLIVAGNRSGLVTIQGLPDTLAPGVTRTYTARITPQAGAGSFTVNDSLVTQPCSLPLPMEFTGTWFRGRFSADQADLTLPTIDLCDTGMVAAVGGFTLQATQTNGLRATIHDVISPAPFSVDLVAGSTITSQIPVTITASPNTAGTFSDTIKVVVGPCYDTVTVVVSCTVRATDRSVSITSTDYGVLGDGESSQQTIVITNTGSSDLTIDALIPDPIVLPWQVVSVVPSLPTTLAPNQAAQVVIGYSYEGVDRQDTLVLQVRSSHPNGGCADTTTYVLTGRTASQRPVDDVVVVIPQDLTAVIGEMVSIPVSLTSPESLAGAGITSMDFVVHYDGSILQITDAEAVVPGLSVSVTPSGRGSTTITVQRSEIEEASPLFVLRGQTYLGGALETVLDIDTVQSSRGGLRSSDGKLTLTGDCAVETKLISLGLPPAVRVLEFGGSSCTMEISTLTHDPSMLQIVSLDGRVIAERTIAVQPGQHQVEMVVGTVANGWYTVRMVHGRHLVTSSLTISR